MTVITKERKNEKTKEDKKLLGAQFSISEIERIEDFADKHKDFKKSDVLRDGAQLFLAVQEAISEKRLLGSDELIDKIVAETALKKSVIHKMIKDIKDDLSRNSSRIISNDESIIALATNLGIDINETNYLTRIQTIPSVSKKPAIPFLAILYHLKNLSESITSCSASNSQCSSCPMDDECTELKSILHSVETFYKLLEEYKEKPLKELIAEGVQVEKFVQGYKLLKPDQGEVKSG